MIYGQFVYTVPHLALTIVESHTSSETTTTLLKMSLVSLSSNFHLQFHPNVKAQKLVDNCTSRAMKLSVQYLDHNLKLPSCNWWTFGPLLALCDQITGVSKLFPGWWSWVKVIVSIHGAGWVTTYRIWLVVASCKVWCSCRIKCPVELTRTGQKSRWIVSRSRSRYFLADLPTSMN